MVEKADKSLIFRQVDPDRTLAAQDGRRETVASIRRLSHVWQILLLAALYFTAARLSLTIAIPPGYATAVWPPSGIALAALLLFGSRVWPGIWLGATLANAGVASSLFTATVIGVGNTLEALVGAALISRYIGVPRRFERAGDVVKFVAIAAVVPAIAATVAMVPLRLEGALAWPELVRNWWTWWQGDATGIIIVGPLLLSWSTRRIVVWPAWKQLEAVCLGLLLLALTNEIFEDASGLFAPFPLSFAILPFIIWAALRFSQRVVTTAIAGACAIAIHHTLKGLGPFALWSVNESLLILLAFISTVVVTGLVLSAVTAERTAAMEKLAQAMIHLREQAVTDPLTGLYNRRYLQEFLRREWVRARRKGSSLAVIMIDLDHFKQVNDRFGHEAGDFVLTATAALLRSYVRTSDMVCRYGGEEFALVLPEATPESVRERAGNIQAAIRDLDLRHRGSPIGKYSASFGIALFPDNADGPEAVLRAADEALYAAKGAGRDRIVVSDAAPTPR